MPEVCHDTQELVLAREVEPLEDQSVNDNCPTSLRFPVPQSSSTHFICPSMTFFKAWKQFPLSSRMSWTSPLVYENCSALFNFALYAPPQDSPRPQCTPPSYIVPDPAIRVREKPLEVAEIVDPGPRLATPAPRRYPL